jgi:ABC-type Fe3+ transport system permease subunit
LRGIVLAALAVVAWLAIRRVTEDERSGVARLAPRLRASLALAVDAGLVLAVVAAIFAVCRQIFQFTLSGWAEVLISACVLIALLIIGRSQQTPGELLFETHYWHGAKGAPE